MQMKLSKDYLWLLISRMVVATFLFAMVEFVAFGKVDAPFQGLLIPICYIIAVAYLTSIILVFILRKDPQYRLAIPALSMIDLILITFLIHYTGGPESVYSLLYPLVIIYSTLLIGKRGGVLAAAVGGGLYAILLGLEHYCLIGSQSYFGGVNFTAREIIAKISINAAALFAISILSSFVSGQEKKLRIILAEREDDFKKLDMLHRHIIESVNTGILTFDLRGRIKTLNRAASQITGISACDALQKNVFDLFLGLSELMPQAIGPAKDGRQRLELNFTRGTGEEIVIGLSLSPLIDHAENKIGEIMIFQDLTSHKAMQEQIEKSRKMALIGEMAAGLAHEMRNPLAAMGGSIQVLRQGLKLNPGDERLMQIVLRGKEQLDVFLRDFLLLARPAAGAHEMVDLTIMIGEILETLRFGPDWNERIEVVLKGVDSVKPAVFGSRHEIRQALINIIINAVQAMPDGGTLTITQGMVVSDNPYFKVTVQDTGCGIDCMDTDRVFEPFYTTKDRGTGLGLAIAARVMESLQGKIEFSSSVEVGTKMELSFPFHGTEEDYKMHLEGL
jgi:two-component system sensor histidine kinase PilS (NtrC family)